MKAGRPKSTVAADAAKWFIEQNDLGMITSGYAACKRFNLLKKESIFYRAVREAGRGDLIKRFSSNTTK